MGNTLGTTNADVIAQEALKALQATLPVIGQIASDFSDEGAKFNETVIVHSVSAAAAVDFNPLTGYVAADRALVDIPVKIDQHKHHTYSVGVQEASASRVDLIQRFALNAAYSLGAAIVGDLCDLILDAAFSNKTTKALGAGGDAFDRKQLQLVATALDVRNVPPFARFCLLNSSYYGSLMMDSTLLQILMSGGADAAKSGTLPKLAGFDVSQYSALPDNGENLVGFAGGRTALAIATRIPDDPGQGQSNCRISVVRDEASGMALQVREWYNPDMAQFKRSYTLMYGVAVGQAAALQRIVSA